MMKKLLLAGGILFGLLIVTIVAIPFVIDIDQYRPQIVAAANNSINGKIEIRKLGFSLWGRLEVKVEGLSVTDTSGTELVSVERTFVEIPFGAILGGHPRLLIEVESPMINVVKDKKGNLNLLSLMKSSPEGSPAETGSSSADEQPDSSSDSGSAELPFADYIDNAAMDLVLNNADLVYDDQALAFRQDIKGLKVTIRDLSLSKTMVFEVSSEIATRMGDAFSLAGPFLVKGKVTPNFEGLQFQSADIGLTLDMDQMKMQAGPEYKKEAGQPLNLALKAFVSIPKVELQEFQLRLFEAALNAKMTLENATNPPETMVASISANNPGLDLTGKFRVKNFAIPNASAELNAKVIDIDQIFPGMAEKREAEKKAAEQQKQSGPSKQQPAKEPQSGPPVDYDKMLDPMRDHPVLKRMKIKTALNVKRFRGFGVEANNFQLAANFGDLVAELSKFHVEVFKGKIDASARFDIKPKMPVYRFSESIQSLDLNYAVGTFAEAISNTVSGLLTMKIKGKGKSLNYPAMIKNLDSKGEFALTDAELRTVDVAKMTKEGLEGSMSKIKEKVPPLGSVNIPSIPDEAGRYDKISSNFTLKGGVFTAPNFLARSHKARGLDLDGHTRVDILQDELKANWFVVDTGGRTGLAKVGIKTNGVEIDQLFVKGKPPARFPVKVGCKVTAPCYDYGAIPDYLGSIALKKVKGAASDLINKRLAAEKAKLKKKLEAEKAKAAQQAKARLAAERKKAEKKAKEAAKKKAKEQLKNKGKDALKKFGF